LDVCAGKTEDDFQASPAMLETASTLAYPELHAAENFTELQFFTELRKLLEICGYYDFSWRDLHVPESKRLRHQLSAILNLAKFREEQLKVYAELNEPVSTSLRREESIMLHSVVSQFFLLHSIYSGHS
jgi:hypothetical protein